MILIGNVPHAQLTRQRVSKSLFTGDLDEWMRCTVQRIHSSRS